MDDLVRLHCSVAQFTRFKKVSREPFYLLDASPSRDQEFAFVMSGSTGSPYKMSISQNKISCSCMDAALNCRRLGLACKHMCFLVSRVFDLQQDSIVEYLLTLRLSTANMAAIAIEYNRIPTGPRNRPLGDAFSSMKLTTTTDMPDFGKVARNFEDCPICYCPGLQGDVVGCPDCGNGLHGECAKRWLAHSAHATCVYCRSPVWKEYGKWVKLQ